MGEVRQIRRVLCTGSMPSRMKHKYSNQRGSIMVIAMVTMIGLLAVSALTLVKVKRGLAAASQARFQSAALFAAESGVSAGLDFLRKNISPSNNYTSYISANNDSIQTPTGIPGNTIMTGQLGSLFGGDIPMSYAVSILNNPDDPGFAAGTDTDGIVIVRSIGRGPGTSMVTVEVRYDGAQTAGRPCPGYAQRGIASDGAGRNDCLGDIETAGGSTVFTPGTTP